MDKIAKLLKKINAKERAELLALIERLVANDRTLPVIKLKNTDFYRLRYKNFRIIFHKDGEVVIDSIKMRNENTYKNL